VVALTFLGCKLVVMGLVTTLFGTLRLWLNVLNTGISE